MANPRPKGPKPAGPPSPPPPAGAAGAGAGQQVAVAGVVNVKPLKKGKTTAKIAKHCVVCKNQKPSVSRIAAKNSDKCIQHQGFRFGGWPGLRALLLALLALLLALLLSRCPGGPVVPPVVPVATPVVGKPVQKPPVVTCPTTLRVVVFFDRNVNGEPDDGEQPLPGFEFRVLETGTEGVTRAGGADALEATPGRKYTVNIVGRVGVWMLQTQSEEVTVPACADKTVYFGAMAQQTPSLTPVPTSSPTPASTVAPTAAPASPTPSQGGPTATPTSAPKTPSPAQDYGCNCTAPSTFVPTPSPRPSGIPSPTPIFK